MTLPRLIGALTLAGALAVVPGLVRPESDALIPVVTPSGTIIQAELADTPAKRARGLMQRESLPKDRGMLFTFTEAQPWTFWMKNTLLSLDIIWLDQTKKVVHVASRVPICTRTDDSCPQYQPNQDAMYVLEVNAGQAEPLGIKAGTTLRFTAPGAPDADHKASKRGLRR